MEVMTMDQTHEHLLTNSKQNKLAKHWVYAAVGLVTGCCLTVGICYLFFSLGLEKGAGNTRNNENTFSDSERLSQDVQKNDSKTDANLNEKIKDYYENVLGAVRNVTNTMNINNLHVIDQTRQENRHILNVIRSVSEAIDMKDAHIMNMTKEDFKTVVDTIRNVTDTMNTNSARITKMTKEDFKNVVDTIRNVTVTMNTNNAHLIDQTRQENRHILDVIRSVPEAIDTKDAYLEVKTNEYHKNVLDAIINITDFIDMKNARIMNMTREDFKNVEDTIRNVTVILKTNMNLISDGIKMLKKNDKILRNTTERGLMELMFSKKEGSKFTSRLESIISNNSLKEMTVIEKTKREIMVMIEDLKKTSCFNSRQDISTATPSTTVSGPCRSDEILYNSHCYYFEDRGYTWEKAQEDCRKRNSNLVKIEGYSEWYWIKQKVYNRNYRQVWIGAYDKIHEGYWRWISDYSRVTYTRWARDEPNNDKNEEHCASMKRSSSYKWNDLPCNFLCNYVCERYN